MGTLRDIVRSGFLAACFGCAAMGIVSLKDRADNFAVIELIAKKKADALAESRPVGWYDKMTENLEDTDYSGRWAAGYFVAAGLALAARYSIKRK
ncbi:hypothetical protein HN935_02975 [archaeon]|jgi:hypothetical protein|nr:hypothetical protein [archaeon]